MKKTILGMIAIAVLLTIGCTKPKELPQRCFYSYTDSRLVIDGIYSNYSMITPEGEPVMVSCCCVQGDFNTRMCDCKRD